MRCLWCVFALCFASLAISQDRVLRPAAAGESGGRVALLIGNSAYKDAPLANPVNDASDMAQALRSLGFKVILRRNASQREMRQAVREFGGELRRASVGLFYFAGHGIQIRGGNYLVPIGADIQSEADVEDLSMDANYVLRTMEESQAKFSIVILDACRNNPYARSFRSASRGLAQMSAATGAMIAFATAPGSVAADGTGRNGVYTKHLLRHIRTPDVPVELVFKRVREDVEKETSSRQVPWESSSLKGDFYFTGRGAPAPVAVPRDPEPAPVPVAAPRDSAADELNFWDSIKSSTNPAEYRAYLDQYPNGRFAGLARVRMEAYTPKPAPPAALPSVTTTSRGTSNRDCVVDWRCTNERCRAKEAWRSGSGTVPFRSPTDRDACQRTINTMKELEGGGWEAECRCN